MNRSRKRRVGKLRIKKKHHTGLSLVALMDMFTNLVFFLLVSQGATVIDAPRKEVELPESYTDQKPRPSVVVTVSRQTVMVEGETLATTEELATTKEDSVPAIRQKLAQIKSRAIGVKDVESDEVTILADRVLPFKILKKLMSTCASAGYSKISFGVSEKAPS